MSSNSIAGVIAKFRRLDTFGSPSTDFQELGSLDYFCRYDYKDHDDSLGRLPYEEASSHLPILCISKIGTLSEQRPIEPLTIPITPADHRRSIDPFSHIGSEGGLPTGLVELLDPAKIPDEDIFSGMVEHYVTPKMTLGDRRRVTVRITKRRTGIPTRVNGEDVW